jgi:hypothetical protein
MFLIQDLRAAGFFPDKSILSSEDSVREFLRRLVQDSEENIATAVQSGGIRLHRDPRETVWAWTTGTSSMTRS